MVSSAPFILVPLWIYILSQACTGEEELPREAVLSWFKERVLEDLGLEEPPPITAQDPDGDVAQPEESRRATRRAPRTSRTSWINHQTNQNQGIQIILFPSADSACASSDSAPGETASSHFTYYFEPSMNHHENLVTSAHFWFYMGEGATANSSAQLFLLTSAQQLLRVRCPACQCHANETDKTPFLHLHAEPRDPVRSHRRAPVTIPWSPSAIDLLQRPSQERPQHSDCHRAEIEISFEELGWDNWIVHPKVLTFYYCHGNCSAWDRTTSMLGIAQCCAPVPGSMKSLRITTTSDGGYSFKYETLPNIVPEECTCI
ncbi:Inhibin alpha chain [Nibea albiflora]|uniref:Inhibin alpha chain n=1 Tax=Nibea albiflora TaxID=240163 RepID=A0ACB7ERB7_NIBAL|nr:Inhibin alpha chain [Nibea albiflora]